MIVNSCDVEENPVSEKVKSQIPFCHWNLNGLAAHSFIKIFPLQELAASNEYDIICLTEKLFDRICIPRYNLFCIEHPSNKKRGGACIYHTEHVPVKKREGHCKLQEFLVAKLRLGG